MNGPQVRAQSVAKTVFLPIASRRTMRGLGLIRRHNLDAHCLGNARTWLCPIQERAPGSNEGNAAIRLECAPAWAGGARNQTLLLEDPGRNARRPAKCR